MKNNFYPGAFKKHSSKVVKLFTALMMSAFLFSCEQFNDVEEVVDKVKEEQEARTFVAELGGLNNSGVTGEVVIEYMKDGQFEVLVKADGLVPNMVHPQHIHGFGFMDKDPKNAVCPPMSAAGEDGLLTLPEGLPFYGPVLVPLDSELVPLTVQEFPMANANGMISYIEFTSLKAMLMAIDKSNDGKQSLANLSLEDRVIVLHGAYVKDNMIVPPGTEGAEYVATLPVACGELVEVL
ncbi:hypothetical protein [Nafulsella turpanensis]|uniref:hypothetical protein n=1 Tax=Nafulsella turpanensis TaxID=1265690 RepID=UPI001268A5F7|nr:hypothetical protein [Nafulsella turpanensis]